VAKGGRKKKEKKKNPRVPRVSVFVTGFFNLGSFLEKNFKFIIDHHMEKLRYLDLEKMPTVAEAVSILNESPDKFDHVKRNFSEPLETLLPLRTLTKISAHSDVRKEIKRRAKDHEKSVEDFRRLTSDLKAPNFHSNWLSEARKLDHQHGLGKESSPIGNALVHHVVIPLNELHNERSLTWNRPLVNKYHKLYSEAESGKNDSLESSDFELTHPLDKSRIPNLENLEIRDQPNFQTVTSEFCGDSLKSFCVSCCDLTSLPTNALVNSKHLKAIDISGNQSLTQSEIEKTLSLMSEASSPIESLDLSNLKLTKLPKAIRELRYLKSLKMENCPLMSLSSDELPPSLTELSIQGHQVQDIHSQLSPGFVFSKLRRVNISMPDPKISTKQLVDWIDKGTKNISSKGSPVEYFGYSTKDKLTADQKTLISTRLPNLQKDGFHLISFK
jgi:hypothetical protein